MGQGRTKFLVVQVISLVLTWGIFALDLAMPQGIPVGLLYLTPILLLCWAPSKAFPFIVAALGSILTGLDFFLSPPVSPISYGGITNRLIIVLVLWNAAFGVSTISETDPESERPLFGLSRRTFANLTSLGLLVILLGVGSYRVAAASWESNKLVAHTHEVLTELSLTLSAIKDSETGQRGFLLTGEERYLELCRQAVSEVHGHLERLTDLTRDSPEHQDRLPAFTSRVEEKLAELQETLVVSQNQGLAAALRIVTAEWRKALMDDLRHQVEEIEKTERGLLTQRQQQAKSFSDLQTIMLALGGLLMVVVMGIIVLLLLRREQLIQREFATALRQTLATLDATRDGLFVFDPGTLRFSYVNAGAVLQVGYSREELLGLTPLDIKPEFDEPRFRAMLAPLMSGAQRVHSFTTVHRRKDGVDVPVEINMQCVEAGTAEARLIAVVRDITEHKRTEEALRQAAKEIRDLYDNAPCGYHSLDQDGVITEINRTELAWLGFTRDEVVGKKKFTDFVMPESASRFQANFPLFKDRGWIRNIEIDLIAKDGSILPVVVNATAVKDEAGRYVKSRSTLFDITERRLMEARLLRSRDQLKTFVEQMPVAVAMLDRHLRYVAASRQWIHDYRLDHQDLIGRHHYDIFPEIRQHPEWQAVHQRCLAGDAVRKEEDRFVRQDGREGWLYWDVRPWRDEEGAVGGIVLFTEDITERKRVEEELKKKSQLLEAANKELEAFSYSVSHDLRAPLRSLHGFSQALFEDYAGRLDDKGIDYLNRIQASSRRMEQLVEDLLRLSRTTRMELRREPVDLSALVLGLAEEVRKQWPGHRGELIVAPGLTANGDRRLLSVVFDNLLGNAWKFTSKREQAVIEVGAARRDGETVYFVRDNGAGFDMAYAGKLFGVFQRLHAMTEFPGTGIGLATVQRIVHRHGGRIWAEGAVGQGATVFFTLDG